AEPQIAQPRATGGLRSRPGSEAAIDQRRPPLDRTGRNVHELEAEAQVFSFVDAFKRQRVLVADPAGRPPLPQTERPDEEHPAVEQPTLGDLRDRLPEPNGHRVTHPAGERKSAHHRTIMNLHRRPRADPRLLAMTLQPDDRVDEQRIPPRLKVAL